jgi:type IV pilus assembly protein PilE
MNGRPYLGSRRYAPLMQIAPSAELARRQAGFTLIELLIALSLVAILLAVALPTFNDAQRKSRRTDAFNALNLGQSLEERWRSNNSAYGTASDLALASTSPSGYYAIAVSDGSNTATGYILTATAVSGLSQAADTGCQLMAVKMDSGNLFYGSTSAGTVDWGDAKKCWAK